MNSNMQPVIIITNKGSWWDKGTIWTNYSNISSKRLFQQVL